MGIKGFQGTSLLDYPGRIAALIFYGGCNLTCPFCHNPTLVIDPEQYPDYPTAALLDEIRERRRFIDGVVVSGGEPTLDPGLADLLRQIKEFGLLVKLDTNGLRPQVVEGLMGEGLVDFVALDLKTSPERYGELHPGPVDVAALRESVRLLLQGEIEYELRTTCVPTLVGEEEIRAMGDMVRGAGRWVLQQYVPGHALDEALQELEPHSEEALRRLAEVAGGYVEEVALRGV